MKILLRGYYGWGNLGDDVLMTVVYKWLRQQFPAARIDIFSGFTPNNAACRPPYHEYHQYIHRLLPDKPRIVDWAQKEHYDLMVQGGGGVHFDHTHGGTAYQVANTLIKTVGASAITTAEKLIRKAARKPLNISYDRKIGLGIGVGDFTSDGRSFAQHASKIGEYDFIWVRDDLSVSWLKKLKFGGKVVRSSDLAFATDAWLPENRIPKRKNSVGLVTLTKETIGPAELETQRQTVKELTQLGYEVSVYLFQEVLDKHLVSFFEQDCAVHLWRPQIQEMQNYLVHLGSNELIISGRAHGVILGACLGVPSLTIETSTKLREVSAMFPTSTALLSPSTRPEKMVDAVQEKFKNLASLESKVQAEVEANKERVTDAFARTAAALKK